MRRADRRRAALTALALAMLPACSLAGAALTPAVEAAAPETQTTSEPTPELTPEASPEFTPAPTSEATPAPTHDPNAEEEASPTPGASELPSPTPGASEQPSPAPTTYPTLEFGMSGEDVLRLQTRLAELKYLTYAEGMAPDGTFDEATRNAVMLFQAQLQLEPTGVADDALQQLIFAPDTPPYEEPGTTPMPTLPPGFPSGGWPQGGGAWGGFPSGMPGADATPGIIPGVALTSSHSSGDRNMTLYGAVDMDELDRDQSMTALSIGDAGIDISLTDTDGAAASFSAAYDEGVLTLSAEGDAGAWHVNGYALRVLEKSGVTRLVLQAGGGECALPTGEHLGGSAYAALRARGFVSQDFDYTITPSNGGIAVTVDGQVHDLSADGGALYMDAAGQE